jgi:uncharacterized membrane protein YbhN (UPF0104 family)
VRITTTMAAPDPDPLLHPPPGLPDAGGAEDDVDAVAAQLAAELARAAARPAKKRRWWALPARLLISAVMLWYLVKKIADVSFADLVPTWSSTTIAWMAVALALTLFSVVLSAERWQQVLLGMDLHVPFRRVLSHYFAGQFVSNVLPTTIGGDVLRVARITNDTGDSADSFASVVIERLTGWLVLPLLTFLGFALNPGLRSLGDGGDPGAGVGASRLAFLIAVGTLVALFAILFVANHPRLGGRFATRGGWRRFIGAVHLGVIRLRRHRLATARVVGAGFLYQFVIVLAAAAAAASLGIADVASLTVLLAFIPAVLMLQVLPIGIAGLGVREGALVLFLSPLGVPKSDAVALGLLLFGLNLVASLAGAPAFLTGARGATSGAEAEAPA